MLHDGTDGIDGLFEGAAKWGFLPAPGVPLDTKAVAISSHVGEANPIVAYRGLVGTHPLHATGNQMLTVHANVHTGGELVGLQQLGKLGLSNIHRMVHGSVYQPQAPIAP